MDRSISRARRPYGRMEWVSSNIRVAENGRFENQSHGFTLRSNIGSGSKSEWVDFNIDVRDFEMIAATMFKVDPSASTRAFAKALLSAS